MKKHLVAAGFIAFLFGLISIGGCGEGVSDPTTTLPVTTTTATITTTTTATTTTSTTTTSTTTTTLPDFTWTLATGNAQFGSLEGFSCVAYNGKIWVIGGNDQRCAFPSPTAEVWSSVDGATWVQETADGGFGGRFNHASVVFDGKMWIIGGDNTGLTLLNDVWYSTDGQIWTQKTASAAFSGRTFHACVVYDDGGGEKMWVIGGRDNGGTLNDVWSSTNGALWNPVTTAAQFTPRWRHACTVMSGKMWLVAGVEYRSGPGDLYVQDDAWYSTNGSTWTKAGNIRPLWGADSTSEVARFDHTLVPYVVNGTERMFILAGENTLGTYHPLQDCRYTADGAVWTTVSTMSAFPARSEHRSVIFNNKIWVIGGYDDTNWLTDVWYTPKP
jgi:hypothetical protein